MHQVAVWEGGIHSSLKMRHLAAWERLWRWIDLKRPLLPKQASEEMGLTRPNKGTMRRDPVAAEEGQGVGMVVWMGDRGNKRKGVRGKV